MEREKKNLTRICLSYDPPRLKFEFTKGEYRTKYHKTVRMEKYFAAERSTCPCGAQAIHDTLVNNHSELSQASDKVLISIIEKLFSHYRTTQGRNLLDMEGDTEQLPTEQSADTREDKNDTKDQGMRVNVKIERGTLTLSPIHHVLNMYGGKNKSKLEA